MALPAGTGGSYAAGLGGSCCTAQLFPSGSSKNTNDPHGKSCTSLAPPANRLPVPVRAGELAYRGG